MLNRAQTVLRIFNFKGGSNMKKKGIIVAIVSVAVLSAVVVGASTYPVFRSFFVSGGNARQTQSQVSRIAAYVNGTPIYEKTVDADAKNLNTIANTNASFTSGQSADVEGRQKSRQEILDSIIQNEVLSQEAAKQGISVSDAEAQAAVEKTDETIQNLLKNGSPQEREYAQKTWDMYASFAAGYGLSVGQYEKQVAAKAEKSVIVRQKLYQAFVQKLQPTQRNDVTALWNRYVKNLVQKADIRRIS